MPSTAQNTFNTIEAFISQAGGFQKKASAPLSEPGSVGGETTHPIKSVDDRLIKATEGARSAENTKDVKEQEGPASVDSTPIAKSAAQLLSLFAKRAEGEAISKPGTAASDHLQIGLNVQATGDDPAHETSSAKGGKEDGGTRTGASTHPARTDNDELDGGKYASDLAEMPLEKLAAEIAELGNGLLADLAVLGQFGEPKQASAPAPAPQADPKMAHQAGWDLAALAASGQFDKKAADTIVTETLYDVIKTAYDQGNLVADYLDAMNKAAGDPMAGGPPMDPSAGGGLPPGGPPPPGGDPMGAGGMAPPGGDMSSMDGPPGSPPGGGGPPPPGGGGPPPGAGGPPGGGGGDPQLEQLLQLIVQSGIPPEQIAQMIAQSPTGSKEVPAGAGGPPPGAPPASGGAPGAGGPDKSAAAKLTAKEAQAQALEMLNELIVRSRAGK